MAERFGKREVTVTMLGEEWTTIVAKLGGKVLSSEGKAVYVKAAAKLGDQLLAASKEGT